MLRILKKIKYKNDEVNKKLLSENKSHKQNKDRKNILNEDINLIKKNAENERNKLTKELGLQKDATWSEITKKYDELFTVK